jgi:hypothetical protein
MTTERIAHGSGRFRNRNEKEFAGYRDAIDSVMRSHEADPLTVPVILSLHRMLFHHAAGRGGNLKTDQNLLAIHPVPDGNGRLARLVTTHELLSAGYGVARYVSVEQRVFDSKNTYYASLYQSQLHWHQGQHDIWPWVSYLVRVLADAYDDFERRIASAGQRTGTKQDRVRRYILEQASGEFRTRDIERALPDISPATIRLVLNQSRDARQISSHGSGPGARWRRLLAGPT